MFPFIDKQVKRALILFFFLIDRAVSACYMPVARHFREVKIKYDTSILKRKSVVKLVLEIDLYPRKQPEMRFDGEHPTFFLKTSIVSARFSESAFHRTLTLCNTINLVKFDC